MCGGGGGGGGDYNLCGISVGDCSLCISAADYSLCMSVGTIACVCLWGL